MKIYLVRHGEAVDEEIDPERPLSKKGITEIERVATFLSTTSLNVSTIFHSRKLRAKQTAMIIAKGLAFNGIIAAQDNLNPNDSVTNSLDFINSFTDDAVLVGHLPFMSKLVGLLIHEDEEVDSVNFHTGSIVCLEKLPENHWIIDWVIHPAML